MNDRGWGEVTVEFIEACCRIVSKKRFEVFSISQGVEL